MVLEATEAFPSSPLIEDLSSYFYTAIKIQQNGPKELKPDEKSQDCRGTATGQKYLV